LFPHDAKAILIVAHVGDGQGLTIDHLPSSLQTRIGRSVGQSSRHMIGRDLPSAIP
jgi:hypothetical protein